MFLVFSRFMLRESTLVGCLEAFQRDDLYLAGTAGQPSNFFAIILFSFGNHDIAWDFQRSFEIMRPCMLL